MRALRDKPPAAAEAPESAKATTRFQPASQAGARRARPARRAAGRGARAREGGDATRSALRRRRQPGVSTRSGRRGGPPWRRGGQAPGPSRSTRTGGASTGGSPGPARAGRRGSHRPEGGAQRPGGQPETGLASGVESRRAGGRLTESGATVARCSQVRRLRRGAHPARTGPTPPKENSAPPALGRVTRSGALPRSGAHSTARRERTGAARRAAAGGPSSHAGHRTGATRRHRAREGSAAHRTGPPGEGGACKAPPLRSARARTRARAAVHSTPVCVLHAGAGARPRAPILRRNAGPARARRNRCADDGAADAQHAPEGRSGGCRGRAHRAPDVVPGSPAAVRALLTRRRLEHESGRRQVRVLAWMPGLCPGEGGGGRSGGRARESRHGIRATKRREPLQGRDAPRPDARHGGRSNLRWPVGGGSARPSPPCLLGAIRTTCWTTRNRHTDCRKARVCVACPAHGVPPHPPPNQPHHRRLRFRVARPSSPGLTQRGRLDPSPQATTPRRPTPSR